MEERWMPVVGFEDCYSVSDLGRVSRTSTFGGKPVWKLLAPRMKRSGYTSFHLCKDGIRTDPLAHRLVWRAFRGEIPDGLEINHINSKRDDPRLENLELMTRSQNAAYAFSHNGRPAPKNPSFGTRNGSAKLTEENVIEIRRLLGMGLFQYEIARMFSVSQPTIGAIHLRRTWRHV